MFLVLLSSGQLYCHSEHCSFKQAATFGARLPGEKDPTRKGDALSRRSIELEDLND
jgi:hypothetical protein